MIASPDDYETILAMIAARGVASDGRRILPEGWVDYARTPTFQQAGTTDGRYGAQWWLDIGGPGSFSANGYDGQYTVLVPDLDVVLVRHGGTPAEMMRATAVPTASCMRPITR